MANHYFTEGCRGIMSAEIDLDLAGSDIRVMLAGLNSTLGNNDAQRDILTISAATTVDEYVGTNYTAGGVALASRTLTKQGTPTFRLDFDAADGAPTWTSLGADAGGNSIGAVVFILPSAGVHPTDSVPLYWIDDGGFPFNGTGNNVTIQWNANGIAQVQL